MLNNLNIVQEAWMGASESGFADADQFIYLNNGKNEVIIRFPYCTRAGNNPHYGVAVGNGPFYTFRSFDMAMDYAAMKLN